MRENLGISMDSNSMPAPPRHVPPVLMLAPCFFETIERLGSNGMFHESITVVYRCLCRMALYPRLGERDSPGPFGEHFHANFFRALHKGFFSDEVQYSTSLIQTGFCDLAIPWTLVIKVIFIINIILVFIFRIPSSIVPHLYYFRACDCVYSCLY